MCELLRYNDMLGLSNITLSSEICAKHVWESVLLGFMVGAEFEGEAADLGAGNGFPGLVVAAMCPKGRFTLFESSDNRAAYLQNCILAMELQNAFVENRHLKRVPDNFRGAFDLVFHRAFAHLERAAGLALELGCAGHVFAGFLPEEPKPQDFSACRYTLQKSIEFKDYKGKNSFIYAAKPS